jgi:hypothetical protein
MRKPTIKTMPAAWTQPLAIISDRLLLISIEPPGVAAGTGLAEAANLRPSFAGSHDDSSFLPSEETIVTVREVLGATAVSFAHFRRARFCGLSMTLHSEAKILPDTAPQHHGRPNGEEKCIRGDQTADKQTQDTNSSYLRQLQIKTLIGFVDGQTANPSLIAKNPEIQQFIASGQKTNLRGPGPLHRKTA